MMDLLTLLQVIGQANEAELTISKQGGSTNFTCTLKDCLELPELEEEEPEPETSEACYLNGDPIEPPDAPLMMTY